MLKYLNINIVLINNNGIVPIIVGIDIELTLQNSGCRCPNVGRAWAFNTRSETLDGPGPIRRRIWGIWMGSFNDSGGAIMLARVWEDAALLFCCGTRQYLSITKSNNEFVVTLLQREFPKTLEFSKKNVNQSYVKTSFKILSYCNAQFFMMNNVKLSCVYLTNF